MLILLAVSHITAKDESKLQKSAEILAQRQDIFQI